MLYHLYELNQAALSPARAAADAYRLLFRNPLNPASHTPLGKGAAAALELFERTTRRYRKPAWDIAAIEVDGREVAVRERALIEKPFCNLVHFERDVPARRRRQDTKLLIVAPLAGHYPTLLRGTVRDLLPDHEVYVTEWQDARFVPRAEGPFDLDDYIDYIIEFLGYFRGDVHVMAVCQPTVPVLRRGLADGGEGDLDVPRSMILMAGPIDTRESPTAVNRFAEGKPSNWFRHNVITQVPWPYPGMMRIVYPGFLQLCGFMGMNFDRHITAHRDLFHNLVKRRRRLGRQASRVLRRVPGGDGPDGRVLSPDHRDRVPRAEAAAGARWSIATTGRPEQDPPRGADDGRRREGRYFRDRPDLCCTDFVQQPCRTALREHHVQPGVGHYGVFNGSRFRAEIVPKIRDFMAPTSGQRRVRQGLQPTA